jgi:hypothetical protein
MPAKRAMLTFYLLLAAIGTAFDFVLYRYATMLSEEIMQIISMTFWALILLVALIVIPHYFIHSKVIITSSEIASAGGFFCNTNDYMTVDSIKSVSVIITPLGSLTGFNFVVVNALGARMLLCFMRKQDVILISKHINDMIRRRNEL